MEGSYYLMFRAFLQSFSPPHSSPPFSVQWNLEFLENNVFRIFLLLIRNIIIRFISKVVSFRSNLNYSFLFLLSIYDPDFKPRNVQILGKQSISNISSLDPKFYNLFHLDTSFISVEFKLFFPFSFSSSSSFNL